MYCRLEGAPCVLYEPKYYFYFWKEEANKRRNGKKKSNKIWRHRRVRQKGKAFLFRFVPTLLCAASVFQCRNGEPPGSKFRFRLTFIVSTSLVCAISSSFFDFVEFCYFAKREGTTENNVLAASDGFWMIERNVGVSPQYPQMVARITTSRKIDITITQKWL